jgi:hypothetical protein
LLFFFTNINPYNDVVWIKDYPGATGRYISFTPYLRSDPKIKLADGFGADYGELSFKDIDNDGIKETIIETKQPFYSFDDSVSPTKVILKYNATKNKNPIFRMMEEKK